jgi:glucose-1-phosphate thymidylyltransferase
MKALVLAAGYGTRLHPLTTQTAKPLLPLGGKAIVEYLVEQLDGIAEIDRIDIVTNDRFAAAFERWARRAQGATPIAVVNDGTSSNEERLGAIGAMHYAVTSRGIDEALLVVGGDQAYTFDFGEFVRFFHGHGSSVALHRIRDPEAIKRYSEVRLDGRGRIVEFREKPAVPRYELCATCLYLYTPADVGRIGEYLESGGNRDAPGYYVGWLHTRTDVYGYEFGGAWFDIGDRAVYDEADRFFTERAAPCRNTDGQEGHSRR